MGPQIVVMGDYSGDVTSTLVYLLSQLLILSLAVYKNIRGWGALERYRLCYYLLIYNHGQNISGLSAQDFGTSFAPSPHLSMLFFCKILVKEASPCIKHKYLRREQH